MVIFSNSADYCIWNFFLSKAIQMYLILLESSHPPHGRGIEKKKRWQNVKKTKTEVFDLLAVLIELFHIECNNYNVLINVLHQWRHKLRPQSKTEESNGKASHKILSSGKSSSVSLRQRTYWENCTYILN